MGDSLEDAAYDYMYECMNGQYILALSPWTIQQFIDFYKIQCSRIVAPSAIANVSVCRIPSCNLRAIDYAISHPISGVTALDRYGCVSTLYWERATTALMNAVKQRLSQ